jgi:hypothetical protein
MSTQRKRPKTILRLKVNGPHIKPGRIPIPELLVICEQAQTAVNRQAEVLRGKRGLRPGPTATLVKAECTLELFSIGRGSAVMSFAGPEPKSQPQPDLDLDMQKLGEAAVREVVKSLRAAKKKRPIVMDIGVKRTFQEMGKLLNNGISSIEWSTPGNRGGGSRVTAIFDEAARARIEGAAQDVSTKPVEIDGRLEMADFKLGDLKCIVHTPDGQRVTCSFPTEIEDDVYQALRHVARVTGTATFNSKTQRTEHIALSSVKVLDPFLGHAEDFFSGLNLEQLTKAQGVDPAFDLRTLKNAWPEGEDVETFLAAIERANH